MKLMTKELEERFKEIGDQYEMKNPLIIATFFDPIGSATWYATEYNPENKTCYGYVTNLVPEANGLYDEWGTFSIDELEAVRRPFDFRIERDIYFKEKSFEEQLPQKKQKRESELNKLTKNKDKKQELER